MSTNGTEEKLFQYADDTNPIISDDNSLNELEDLTFRDKKMRVLVQTTTFQPLLWCTNAVDEN